MNESQDVMFLAEVPSHRQRRVHRKSIEVIDLSSDSDWDSDATYFDGAEEMLGRIALQHQQAKNNSRSPNCNNSFATITPRREDYFTRRHSEENIAKVAANSGNCDRSDAAISLGGYSLVDSDDSDATYFDGPDDELLHRVSQTQQDHRTTRCPTDTTRQEDCFSGTQSQGEGDGTENTTSPSPPPSRRIDIDDSERNVEPDECLPTVSSPVNVTRDDISVSDHQADDDDDDFRLYLAESQKADGVAEEMEEHVEFGQRWDDLLSGSGSEESQGGVEEDMLSTSQDDAGYASATQDDSF